MQQTQEFQQKFPCRLLHSSGWSRMLVSDSFQLKNCCRTASLRGPVPVPGGTGTCSSRRIRCASAAVSRFICATVVGRLGISSPVTGFRSGRRVAVELPANLCEFRSLVVLFSFLVNRVLISRNSLRIAWVPWTPCKLRIIRGNSRSVFRTVAAAILSKLGAGLAISPDVFADTWMVEEALLLDGGRSSAVGWWKILSLLMGNERSLVVDSKVHVH
ncbi:hypothetical protein BR93DRAFT_265945 [Coniochaeta sp. PMI_546]|nr:hypothetical protein BR93DRAFT_265945 [Coniochaeta sp. PMI_546]